MSPWTTKKKVTMTIKEIKRVEVITLVENGKITGNQAAKMMMHDNPWVRLP